MESLFWLPILQNEMTQIFIQLWYHIFDFAFFHHIAYFLLFNEHGLLLQFPPKGACHRRMKFGEFSTSYYWFPLYFQMSRIIPSTFHLSQEATNYDALELFSPLPHFLRHIFLEPRPCIYITSMAVLVPPWQA